MDIQYMETSICTSISDKLFNLCFPKLKPTCLLPDAGGSVYLYEFQHIPSFMRDKRPSFVKSDHADELFSVFGYCFTEHQVKLNGRCFD